VAYLLKDNAFSYHEVTIKLHKISFKYLDVFRERAILRLVVKEAYYIKEEKMEEKKGFIGSLFDFSFSEFVTPKIVSILYMITLGLIGLGLLVGLIMSFIAKPLMGVFFLFVTIPIGGALSIIFTRVYYEILIVIFKLYEELRKK